MPLVDTMRPRVQPVLRLLNAYRTSIYAFVSTLAVSLTIGNALLTHSNFYAFAIYLSRSNRSLLVLANFGVLLALLFGKVVQHIFFGPLRAQEVERLYDRLWYFVTESLLAFTIFRDNFDITFSTMFGFLLFVKSFHWLASDRVEWMDQRPYPGPPRLFHIRINALFLLLWATDFAMFALSVGSTLNNGVSGMVLFASEYSILLASLFNTTSKYALSVYELRRARNLGGETAPPWENKSMYVFYVELITDFCKLSTYLAFFILIITFYGLPLNIIRDVYITARSFYTRLAALRRYQTATRNMDERYPNATQEELTAMSDATCIICREELTLGAGASTVDAPAQGETQNDHAHRSDGPNMTPKKLPCGHVFHFYCLRSWLERQQSCPTCRRSVLETLPANRNRVRAPIPPEAQPQADRRHQNPQPTPAPPAPAPAPQAPPAGGFLGRVLGQNGLAEQHQQQRQAVPQQDDARHLVQQLQQELAGQRRQDGRRNDDGVILHYDFRSGERPQPNAANSPLQLPPMYPGFRGPNGDWQEWEMDQRWFDPEVQDEQPPAPTSQTESGLPKPDEVALPMVQQDPFKESSIPENPREAAAAAALRRFGKSPVPSTSTAPPSEEPSIPEPTPVPSTSNPAPTTTLKIPPLMPLYNLGVNAFRPGAPQERTGAPHLDNRLPLIRTSQTSRSQIHSSTPLSQLPDPLTDEQLQRMSHLTREAIEERLRVLEGISGTIWRCVEELTRIRSVLPDEEIALFTSAGATASFTSAGASTSQPTAPVPSTSTETEPQAAQQEMREEDILNYLF